ncbi:MAG: hypothetical protein FWF18_03750 [Dehalococcoidia bacterium]|nr:hypothetical protein [Dehalococcoidia bacterium]
MNFNTKSFERWRWTIILVAFAALHAVIFIGIFPAGGPDMGLYYEYASKIGQGLLPYRDFAVEYPPGAFIIFYIPYLASHVMPLFSANFDGYSQAFSWLMLAFNIAGLYMVYDMARQAKLSPWSVLIGYTLAIAAIGSIAVQRFDLPPAIMMLAALWAFSRSRYKIAWGVLVVGGMTKIFPLALAPLFLLYQLWRGDLRKLLPSLAVCAGAAVVIAVPFLIVDAGGFFAAFTTQGGRDLQLESLYASLLLFADSLGIGNATPYQGPVSLDVASPLSASLARMSFVFMALGAFLMYGLYFRHLRKSGVRDLPRYGMPNDDLTQMINYSFAVVLVLILTSKVFSPQFILWLYPLFPLLSGRFRAALWGIFIVAACFTQYIYPVRYWDLVDKQVVMVWVLLLRNALLVLMVVLLAMERPEPDDLAQLSASTETAA